MSDTLDYKKIILENINNTLKETNLPLKEKTVGKVRDTYRLNEDELLIVTSDRQSAFDRILATVPFKGAVLNLTSGWWFNKPKRLLPIICYRFLIPTSPMSLSVMFFRLK